MDPYCWSADLKRHLLGKFSMCALSCARVTYDHTEVDTGSHHLVATMINPHAGANAEAAKFLERKLVKELIRQIGAQRSFNRDIIEHTLLTMERDFMQRVGRKRAQMPAILTSGCSVLVAFIDSQRRLHIGNVGDIRLVIGTKHRGRLTHDLVSEIHNVNDANARQEFRRVHGYDSVASIDGGPYRIRGQVELTRSIGHGYLKRAEYAITAEAPPDLNIYHIEGPFVSYLKSNPFVTTITLAAVDEFIIIATASFWDVVTMEEAVELVSEFPDGDEGAARKLVIEAITRIALSLGTTYKDIVDNDDNDRMALHDNISVVVIFLNHTARRRRLQNEATRGCLIYN